MSARTPWAARTNTGTTYNRFACGPWSKCALKWNILVLSEQHWG